MALVPLLIAFLWWAWRKRQQLITQFIPSRLLAGLMAGVSLPRRKIRLSLIVLAVTLSLVALARPQWGFDWEEVKQRGLDIVVAIDTSRSMLADDVKPDRLTKAKYAALDLMQQAKSDRLGLVAFAGTAFLQCPLTVDDEAFRQSINTLDVNIIPQGGTALTAAIETALAAFKDEADNYKVLVLFTDGEDHDSAALEAAKKAAKEGLRIFTIGIGTADGELLRIRDEKGNLDYLKDDQGNVVKSRLNETLLQQIAGATEGGFYLPLRGAKTIDTLYERGLAPLPKSDLTTKHVRRYHEQYRWALMVAIVLLLAELLLPERTRIKQAEVQSPKSKVEVAAAILALIFIPFIGNASPASAMKHYKAGQYTNALTEYERLLDEQSKNQKTEDPRLHFNAGDAAYQATNYDAAIKHFSAVLVAPDIKLQAKAYYNLGNVHFRLGEQADDLDKLEESWKEAIKQFEHAAALDKQDEDTQFNLAFVRNAVEQIEQFKEALRRAKSEADAAVRQRNYRRAVQIMDELMAKGGKAAKPFEEFTKKLKDVDAIANPPLPQP